MAKNMKIITTLLVVVSIGLGVLYAFTKNGVVLSLLISFSTTAYHFLMRLAVGGVVNAVCKNNVDYKRRWFKVGMRERKFYNFIKVKKWKDKMPTYNQSFFDVKNKTLTEIVMATCQAEIVHEIIILLSFLPIIFSIWLGEFWVFLITSLISALIDTLFVIMQRYNRPRLVLLINKIKR